MRSSQRFSEISERSSAGLSFLFLLELTKPLKGSLAAPHHIQLDSDVLSRVRRGDRGTMSTVGAELGLIPLVRSKKRKKDSEISREQEDNSERSGTCSNDDYESRDYDSSNAGDSLIRIPSLSASPVVIGRFQLLKSFRAACNQHVREEGNDKESSFRETLEWGEKALSRKLLRFSDDGIQTRGKYVQVQINGTAISSNLPTAPEDEWSTNSVKIKPGDILSFKPFGGQGLLEFRIVALKPRTRIENDEWAIAKGNRRQKSSMNKRTLDESKGPRIIDLTGESERGETKRAKMDSKFPRQVTLDDESKSKHPNIANNSSMTNSVKSKKPPFIVHFFPFGNGTCMFEFDADIVYL